LIFQIKIRFEQVKYWINSIRDASGEAIDVVLIGNKADTTRAIAKSDAEKVAKEHGISYFETSAKPGSGVDEAFPQLASLVLKRNFGSKSKPPQQNNTLNLSTDKGGKEKSCC
jgi:GTPase SAR1 family protein